MKKLIILIIIINICSLLLAKAEIPFFFELLAKYKINSDISNQDFIFRDSSNYYKINNKNELITIENFDSNKTLIDTNSKSDLEIFFAIIEKGYENENQITLEEKLNLPIFDSRIQTVADLRLNVIRDLLAKAKDYELQRDLILLNHYYYRKMSSDKSQATKSWEKIWLQTGYQIGKIAYNLKNSVYKSNYQSLTQRDEFYLSLQEYFDFNLINIRDDLPSLEKEKLRAQITGYFLAQLEQKLGHRLFDENMNEIVEISFIKDIFKDIDPVLKKHDYFPIRSEYRKKIRLLNQLKERTEKNQIELIFSPTHPIIINELGKRTEQGISYRNIEFFSLLEDSIRISAENISLSLEKYGSMYRIQINTDNVLKLEDNSLYGKNFSLFSPKIEEKSEQEFSITLIDQTFITVKDQSYQLLLTEIMNKLEKKGVPKEWFIENVNHEKFKLHDSMEKFFRKLPEHKVKRKEKDKDWYLRRFGVNKKIEKGKKFIKKYQKVLDKVENKHGVHYELVVALIGIETDYAEAKQRGYYYTFNALVSQYIYTSRKRFSVNELKALYKFSTKIDKPTYYFIGSFAGASGWGQFIPTSQLAYFIDENEIDKQTDIYSVEDNLFSIENYLYKHGVNGRTANQYKKRYNGVYAYNHSSAYVKAVLYIYDGLRKERKK